MEIATDKKKKSHGNILYSVEASQSLCVNVKHSILSLIIPAESILCFPPILPTKYITTMLREHTQIRLCQFNVSALPKVT